MGIKILRLLIKEALTKKLDESARPGQGRKRNRRFKKQVASNTLTSDDGDHKIFGTHHYDQKDNEGLKKEKKNYSYQTRKALSAHINKLRAAGKEVDLGVEGGSHKSTKKGHERDIVLKATKGKRGKGVHPQSNEDPSIVIPSGFMKDDADRTPEEKERLWPGDSDPDIGPPKGPNPDSKRMSKINRDRDIGFAKFAKKAGKKGRGSGQLVGTGHTGKFAEQFRNAILNYLNETSLEQKARVAAERDRRTQGLMVRNLKTRAEGVTKENIEKFLQADRSLNQGKKNRARFEDAAEKEVGPNRQQVTQEQFKNAILNYLN